MLIGFEKYVIVTKSTDAQRDNKKQAESETVMNDLTFITWIRKGAQCKALNEINCDPICDSDNQQVKCKGKPQATQPYLRSSG